MKKEFNSFFDIYDQITQEREKWCYFNSFRPDYTAEDLFSSENALYFIKNYFSMGGKEKALRVLENDLLPMTQYRSNHTLSAYLLGIAIRDGMHIEMKELPKLSNEINKNFLYFWSLTCLYHDFTVALEEKSQDYLDKLINIEAFVKYFKLKHSFIDESEDGKLCNNYYLYRVGKNQKIDHGIAGAMLFYDGLMRQYDEAKENENIPEQTGFTHKNKHYSRDFKKHILLIANTIAKHNMWRSNNINQADYLSYGLEVLITRDNGGHIISIDDEGENDKNKLLFLLALVDTLEPIKCLGRAQNKEQINNPYIALEKMKIKFDYRKSEILLYCPEKYYKDYCNSINSISNWMDVAIHIGNENGEIRITINRRKSLIKKETAA